MVPPVPGRVRVRGGSLYLDAALCAEHLASVHSVAIVESGTTVCLVPLAGAGGYLLKRRNARGDRVVHCGEFLERLGVPRSNEQQWPSRWDATRHVLVLDPAAA